MTSMISPKIVSWQTFHDLRQDFVTGKRIVFTNGCFDLMHPGHVDLLQRARAYGDILVVGLNSDQSVSRIKGSKRPLVPQNERAFVLSGLWSVDYILFFDQDTPRELIEMVRPDVLIKGGDWPVEKIVGRDVVKARGGETLSLPLLEGFSTTGLIEKIVDRYAEGGATGKK